MKPPETYSQVVVSTTPTKNKTTITLCDKKDFPIIVLQEFISRRLTRNMNILEVLTSWSHVTPIGIILKLKIRKKPGGNKYWFGEIEHKLVNNNDPDSIQFSRFTIKIIWSPFELFVGHLHTPIPLLTSYHPQAYNWYDYKVTWYNFMYLRPNTLFLKGYLILLVDPSIFINFKGSSIWVRLSKLKDWHWKITMPG